MRWFVWTLIYQTVCLLSVNCGAQGAGTQHVLDLPGAHIQLFVSTVVSSPDNSSFSLL